MWDYSKNYYANKFQTQGNTPRIGYNEQGGSWGGPISQGIKTAMGQGGQAFAPGFLASLKANQMTRPNQFIFENGTARQNPDFWNNPDLVKGYQTYRAWEGDALKNGANFADQRWEFLNRQAQDAIYGNTGKIPAPDISALRSTYDPRSPGNVRYDLPEAPSYWSAPGAPVQTDMSQPVQKPNPVPNQSTMDFLSNFFKKKWF